MFKIKFVFNFFPVLIWYTNKLMKGFAGGTTLNLIRIRPEYENDEGLLQHELVHVKQWALPFLISIIFGILYYILTDSLIGLFIFSLIGCNIFPLSYLLIKKVKLKCEVQAYREQLKFYKDNKINLFAEFISRKYGLNVSKEEAFNLLNKDS